MRNPLEVDALLPAIDTNVSNSVEGTTSEGHFARNAWLTLEQLIVAVDNAHPGIFILGRRKIRSR